MGDTQISFIRPSYTRYFEAHRYEIMDAISKCLEKGNLMMREETWQFEKDFAEKVGSKYCVTVGSGTDALFLSLKALGIKQGDEVIVPSHTFIASIQAIIHTGATPILVDVGDDELIDVSKIEEAITERTKAIMPVHLTGAMCDMRKIAEIASRWNLLIVEDAAQAFGANWAGVLGHIGCFSFNNAKMMGCYGDGGACVTDDEELYKKLILYKNHWNMPQLSVNSKDYPAPATFEWAYKSRLDNIQAAVLQVKLKYIDEIIERRTFIATRYLYELSDIEGFILPCNQGGRIWQEFHCRVKNRGEFVKYMKEHGIELLVRDETPNHKLPGLGLEHFNLPVTEAMAKDIVRLPLYAEMTNDEVDYVINNVKAYYFTNITSPTSCCGLIKNNESYNHYGK